jgi:hypothetical protein
MTTNMPPPSHVHVMEVDGVTVRSIAVLIPKTTQDDILDSESPRPVVMD